MDIFFGKQDPMKENHITNHIKNDTHIIINCPLPNTYIYMIFM